MKKRGFLGISILILAASMAWLSVTTGSAQEGELHETFDDPALPGWELSPPAVIKDGALELGPTGAAQLSQSIGDALITVQVIRLTAGGGIQVRYRASEAGAYTLQMDSGQLRIVREQDGLSAEMATARIEFPPTTWLTLELDLRSGQQQISIPEIGVDLATVDPFPLPAGGLIFYAAEETRVQFDNLNVQAIEVPLEPSQETAATAPAQQNAPSAALELPEYDQLTWTRLGGPPGGLGYDIRMNPDDPDIMYVTDAHAGIHKSVDGGRTWFPINEGIDQFSGGIYPVFSATIDPHHFDTIWVGTQFTGQIYRSTNGGKTWEERDQGLDSEGRSVRGITVDPNDPHTLYAGVEEASTAWAGKSIFKRFDLTKGEVYKSVDGGQSWHKIWTGDNLARYILVDPRDSNRLYVSTGIFDRDAANSDVPNGDWGGVGILRSIDGGLNWEVLDENNGLGGRYIPSLFMHPENPDVLLAAVTGTNDAPGAYLTRDGGDTWTLVLAMPEGFGAEAVEIASGEPDIWYVAAESLIWRSDDAGVNWQEYPMRTSDRPAGLPIDLQVDPRDPYRIFVNNYGGGNFLSEDGGETWVEASYGYTGLAVYSLIVDPQDPARVMAKNFSSFDGGQSWKPLPVPEFETYALLPSNLGQGAHLLGGSVELWAGAIGSPDWISTPLADIEAERDAGLIIDDRMQIEAIGVSSADSQVIFAGYANPNCPQGVWERCLGVPTSGFYRSADGGASWEKQSVPWDPYATLSLEADPQHPGRLYVGTAAGLYRSEDDGENWVYLSDLDRVTGNVPVIDWSVIPTGLESPIVYDVDLDPADSELIYAAATPGGVYRSTDGGASWAQAAAGMDPNEPVFTVEPDPFRTGVIYASSTVSGVFVSTNHGNSWIPLSQGLEIRNIRGLSISGDGLHIYAGSAGGGVYRLDLTGEAPMPSRASQATSPERTATTVSPSEVEPSSSPMEQKGGWCPGSYLPLTFSLGLIWISTHRRKG
jgi:photosystem II stability/assembly factor-like uncharacterized protein